MSSGNIKAKCPICGDELPIENFMNATVWLGGRKQELFVCRHCAHKQSRKRRWSNPLDDFRAEKRGNAR